MAPYDDDSWSDGDTYEVYPVDPVAQLRAADRRRSRLVVFAWSRPSIVGGVLALVGFVLGLLAGLGAWVVPLMLVLWVLGVLVTPRDVVEDLVIDERASEPDIRVQLAALERVSHERLRPDLHALVASICRSIELILPRTAQQRGASVDLYAVHQTVLRYLPDALNAYFALPPAYAHHHRLAGGRTPDHVLAEQLGLLDREMFAIVQSLADHDAARLLASGQFLQQRFGGEQRRALDLPPGPPPTH
jgi:hypothetical protein